jgi:hypothetical protein
LKGHFFHCRQPLRPFVANSGAITADFESFSQHPIEFADGSAETHEKASENRGPNLTD